VIPLYEVKPAPNGEKYILDAYRSGYLSGSNAPYVKQFEQELADYIGCRYAIAVNSGTAALETALYAVGVTEGDEVIIPSFTIISCALAVLRLGAVPVLVDVTPDSWILDFDQTMNAITDRTKAIMPVDMFGHPTPISSYVRHISKIKVVEDACQALGSSTVQGTCGKVADAAAFSFYANKTITTGEGGAVATNDAGYADRARSYRNLGFSHHRYNKFDHKCLGYNFRMNNYTAAVGVAHLEEIHRIIAKKRMVYAMYKARLLDVEGITWQTQQPWANSVHWMVGLLTRLPREIVQKKLREHGIESREFFKGLHLQECLYYRCLVQAQGNSKPVVSTGSALLISERLYRYGLYLPSSPYLTEPQINHVCDTLKEILGH
jgi:perosamine synthetase